MQLYKDLDIHFCNFRKLLTQIVRDIGDMKIIERRARLCTGENQICQRASVVFDHLLGIFIQKFIFASWMFALMTISAHSRSHSQLNCSNKILTLTFRFT